MTDEQTPVPSAASAPATHARRSVSKGLGTGSANTPERTAAEQAAAEAVKIQYYETRFGVLMSVRYLAKRRSYFDLLHAVSKATSAIFGGAAFFALVGGRNVGLAQWAAAGVAVMSAFDVAFGFAERARKADRQYQRFAELASVLEGMDFDALDPRAVRQAASKRLMIEKDDPTVLEALSVICHNEEAIAEGHPKTVLYQVGWLQKQLAQVMTLPWFRPNLMKPNDRGTSVGV